MGNVSKEASESHKEQEIFEISDQNSQNENLELLKTGETFEDDQDNIIEPLNEPLNDTLETKPIDTKVDDDDEIPSQHELEILEITSDY